MQVDRNLGKTADGRVVERDDPECAYVLAVRGSVFSDAEAHRLGITEFYQRQQRANLQKLMAEAKATDAAKELILDMKAVDKSEVEDKALAGPMEQKRGDEAEGHGASFPPEVRRIRRN